MMDTMINRRVVTKKALLPVILTMIFLFAGMTAAVCEASAATAYKESENNNYVGSADIVSVATGNTFSGTLTDFDDLDFIKFTLTKGSEVNFHITANQPKAVSKYGSSINLNFYKADNTSRDFYYFSAVYDSNLGYIYGNENVYLSEGTYYVRIQEEFLDESLAYKLTFKSTAWENFSEPNNSIGQATSVADGKKYCGILETYSTYRTSNEYDFFKVTAPSQGEYCITANIINIKDNFQIQSFDSSGNARNLFGGKSYIYPDRQSNTIVVTLPKGDTYFRVDAYYYAGKYEFSVTRRLPPPSKVSVDLYGYDDLTASWSAVSGAAGYHVYYKKSTDSSYSYLGKTSATSIKKANLTDGAKYYVQVIPYKIANGVSYNGVGKTSSALYTLKKINKPTVKKSSKKYVKISWKNISGENGYQIAKSTKKSKGFKVVKTVNQKYNTYKLKTTRKKTYYYKIRAYKTVGKTKIYGPWSTVKSYKLK